MTVCRTHKDTDTHYTVLPKHKEGVFLKDMGEGDIGDSAAVQLGIASLGSGVIATETRRRYGR